MSTDHILTLLITERDKLNRAIEALGAPAKRGPGRPPKNAGVTAPASAYAVKKRPDKARNKREFSPEQRAAQAEKMKQYWANKRKAAKKV
jgi:hypothetical protein